MLYCAIYLTLSRSNNPPSLPAVPQTSHMSLCTCICQYNFYANIVSLSNKPNTSLHLEGA